MFRTIHITLSNSAGPLDAVTFCIEPERDDLIGMKLVEFVSEIGYLARAGDRIEITETESEADPLMREVIE
jgi:hypothetical protein